MSLTMPYENVSVFLEPKNPHQSESNMYPTCCIGGALGGGGGAEAYKLHLSKSQFRKSAQTHITTLPTNFSSTGELKTLKIQ